MLTSLDLLVIVFMILAATTLLSLCLMFFIRNETAKRVFLYIASALGLYMSWVGFRIGFGGMFPLQMGIGILTALMCIGAVVLERRNTENSLVARLISAAALIVAFFNAVS